MSDTHFQVHKMRPATLQVQIREMLVSAILSGQLPGNVPVPSTREMAARLNVSRNTVVLAYQALAADGYLVARQRSGFFVADRVLEGMAAEGGGGLSVAPGVAPQWQHRFCLDPAAQPNIEKPANWHDYPYPFIYGQSDASLFPINAWRDCVRQAMSLKWIDAWTDDRYNEDDPELIQQIRQRVLTRRGIIAGPNEVLVTLGAQNALYIIASLMVRRGVRIAMEEPGYPDARNMFALFGGELQPVAVDDDGIQVDKMGRADLAFVTPSHQFPTNVTMSAERRQALLEWADENDAIIIEDDYEYETNYLRQAAPALKSNDGTGRVIYVGSLSKSLMPGLRMGFIVAPREAIEQFRALRKLMLRHPPGNNQRVVAGFLSQGRHDALVLRLHRAYRARWEAMGNALEEHLPGWAQTPSFGGTSFWVRGPGRLDSRELAQRALEEGVVIEPGDICFMKPSQHRNTFRLGFSSISQERIAPGIEILATAAKRLLG